METQVEIRRIYAIGLHPTLKPIELRRIAILEEIGQEYRAMTEPERESTA